MPKSPLRGWIDSPSTSLWRNTGFLFQTGGGGGGGGAPPVAWDATYLPAGYSISEDGLTLTNDAYTLNTAYFGVGAQAVSGKMYWEWNYGSGNWGSNYPGLVDAAQRSQGSNGTDGTEHWRNGMGWSSAGRFLIDGSNTFSRPTYDGLASANLMMAYDHDLGEAWVGINGVWSNKDPNIEAGYPLAGLTDPYVAFIARQLDTSCTLGNHSSNLLYTIPTGFLTLSGES